MFQARSATSAISPERRRNGVELGAIRSGEMHQQRRCVAGTGAHGYPKPRRRAGKLFKEILENYQIVNLPTESRYLARAFRQGLRRGWRVFSSEGQILHTGCFSKGHKGLLRGCCTPVSGHQPPRTGFSARSPGAPYPCCPSQEAGTAAGLEGSQGATGKSGTRGVPGLRSGAALI